MTPYTVTIALPDDALFALRTELAHTPSVLSALVIVPPPPPPVIVTRRLASAPCDHLHTTLVSPLHIVCSQPEACTLAAAEASSSHTPAPYSVMLTDPVAPLLLLGLLLAAAVSALCAHETLPTRAPAVSRSPREPGSPPRARQTTAVSEIQLES